MKYLPTFLLCVGIGIAVATGDTVIIATAFIIAVTFAIRVCDT